MKRYIWIKNRGFSTYSISVLCYESAIIEQFHQYIRIIWCFVCSGRKSKNSKIFPASVLIIFTFRYISRENIKHETYNFTLALNISNFLLDDPIRQVINHRWFEKKVFQLFPYWKKIHNDVKFLRCVFYIYTK